MKRQKLTIFKETVSTTVSLEAVMLDKWNTSLTELSVSTPARFDGWLM
jgi:hypothetical protein